MAVVTKYSYVKDAGLKQLLQEISKSAIITATDHLSLSGTALDVYFKDAISVGDKAILDQLIVDHVKNIYFNKPPVDSDNSVLVRPKAAKKGLTFFANFVQFTT